MKASSIVQAIMALAALLSSSACPIPASRDGIGVRCTTAAGDATWTTSCSLAHVCSPDSVDGSVGGSGASADGLCAPVPSFGACDDGQAVQYGQRVGATYGPDVGAGNDTVDVDSPDNIGDIQRLDEVAFVPGDVRVRNVQPNENLVPVDLCVARDLQRVGGNVVLSEMDVTTLDGLQSLTSIGGGLIIADNPRLSDVAALQNLVVAHALADTSSIAVLIASNVALAPEAAEALVQQLSAVGIEAEACNNGPARQPACQPGTNDLLTQFLAR